MRITIYPYSLALVIVVLSLLCTPLAAAPPRLLQAPFDRATAEAKQLEWAKHLSRQVTETNSVGIELTLIPPGQFKLGSSEALEQLARSFPIIAFNARGVAFRNVIESERPQHDVRITRPFYIAKCNVTLAQFREFVDATKFKSEAERDGKGGWGYTPDETPSLAQKPRFNWRTTGFAQKDDSPVVNVTWNDVVSFCRWLSKKEGKSYRLPTDAEWEFACRAGTVTRFNVGNDPEDLIDVANVADISYFKMVVGDKLNRKGIDRARKMGLMIDADDGFVFTSPVCKFKSNAFGLFDVHGNASTWCSDWYNKEYYSVSPVNDPQGPKSGVTKIVRGGNWQYYPSFCRSASRFEYAPSRREPFLGVRVVRDLDE